MKRKVQGAPVFSVIIPTYQRQGLLNLAVESVLEQTLPNIEVFVVDDAGSPPATVPDDSRITLLRQEANGGKSSAINRALELARGEYVAFLDDDDTWAPTRLATALTAHQETHGDIVLIGLDDSTLGGPLRSHTAVVLSDRTLNKREMLAPMGETTIRRRRCLPFDPAFRACEDLEWSLRLRQSGATYAGSSAQEWFWGRHDGPRHQNDLSVRITSSHQLLSKHRSWYRAHPTALAYRYYRMGIMSIQQGQRSAALGFLLKSLRARPRIGQLRLAANLLRSLTSGSSCKLGR